MLPRYERRGVRDSYNLYISDHQLLAELCVHEHRGDEWMLVDADLDEFMDCPQQPTFDSAIEQILSEDRTAAVATASTDSAVTTTSTHSVAQICLHRRLFGNEAGADPTLARVADAVGFFRTSVSQGFVKCALRPESAMRVGIHSSTVAGRTIEVEEGVCKVNHYRPSYYTDLTEAEKWHAAHDDFPVADTTLAERWRAMDM